MNEELPEATIRDIGGKYGSRRLNRSAGPQDVTHDVCWTGHPSWLLQSVVRSIGPYVDYGTEVHSRLTGERIWRLGDPEPKPENPHGDPYEKRHTVRRGL